ncbi:hypothetical protein I3843_06G163300 [Carya illinoinensis]|nr:hypothetical protein I3843_06G163300 [Carya illinoinensis]
MSHQTSLNNTLDPVERALSNYRVSSGETTFVNTSTHDVLSFSGWNTGEPSSRLNPQNQVNGDGFKIEHGWSSSLNVHSGASPRLEEGRLEVNNILFPGRVNICLGGSRIRSGPLFMEGSSSNNVPQNVNLNEEYAGNSGNSGGGIESGLGPHRNKSSGAEIEQTSSACGSSTYIETSSGSSSYMVEDSTGGSGSSLGTWGLSCKRKALEGTSGQSYPGGSSNSFPQAENAGWRGGSGGYSSSNSLFILSQDSSDVSPSEQQNLSIGIGIRGGASDAFPSSSVMGNAEIPFRNFVRRPSSGNQQEALPLNLSSTGSNRHSHFFSSHESPRSAPFGDSLDLRPAAVTSASLGGPQSHSHAMHDPGLSGITHPFHWNGASTSRVSGFSNSLNSRERGSSLREEPNLRSITRNATVHPMFEPATDVRNSVNDPTSWSLASRNIGNSDGVTSTTRAGASSSIHMWPNSTWIPHHNPPAQNQLRPSESPWSLFPPIDSESGGRSGHFTSLPSGPSSSSQDAVRSSGSNGQGHHQQYPRSAFLMERQTDDILGMPHSLRALAVDIEGRRRLISEDYMFFDPFIYHGMADVHDMHRDMRLDVDNMSYEVMLYLSGGICRWGWSWDTRLWA